MLLLIHFSIILFGGQSQKICSHSYCKVDSCQSRIAASTVWNVVIKNKYEGRICWRNNLCVWKLHPDSCKEVPFEKLQDIDNSPCHDMDREEEHRLRQLGVMKLSKYPHYQEIKSILPFFGIAFIAIIFLIWLYEQVEEFLKIINANFSSAPRISNTIVRFDDCDSCIVGEKVEASSGKTFGTSQRSVFASNKIDDHLIALGYKNLREASLKNQRNKTIYHPNEIPEFRLPKLLLETKTPVGSKSQFKELKHSQKRKHTNSRKHSKNNYNKHMDKNKRKYKNEKNKFNKRRVKSNPKNPTDIIFCCFTRKNTVHKNRHEPKLRPEIKNEPVYSLPKNKNTFQKNKNCQSSNAANIFAKYDKKQTTDMNNRHANRGIWLDESSTFPIRKTNVESTLKSVSNETQREEHLDPNKSTTNEEENEEEDEPKVLSTLPASSVDSSDLGFKVLRNACRAIKAFQYA